MKRQAFGRGGAAGRAFKKVRAAERLAAGELLERWGDPCVFAEEVLGVVPWSRQAELLRAVSEHGRVAVRSGHKVSKSNSLAVLAWWFLLTREDARVVITAPTSRQVRSIVWREVRGLWGRAKFPLTPREPSAQPEVGVQLGDGREIVGFATDEPERMAGISGRNLLFLIDEGSGVPEPIFEAIEGNRAGGARVVMTSNPTRTSGTFFDAFNSKRGFWRTLHIRSTESPNVTGKEEPVPGLATREWVEEKREEWFEGSPMYRVRVMGDFPGEGGDTVWTLGLVEESVGAWDDVEDDRSEVLQIGVDVARFGDDRTVVFPVRGKKALEPTVVERGQDLVFVAGKVKQVADELRVGREIPRVKVDTVGVGAGVADLLRRDDSLDVVDVMSSERADDASEFADLRSELWFLGMRWAKKGGAIPPGHPKLEGELVAPTYDFDGHNRYKVESKKDMKKRLGRSPDLADAFNLAVYPGKDVDGRVVHIRSARR